MSPKQKLHHAYLLVRGMVNESQVQAAETVPLGVAKAHVSGTAQIAEIFLVAQALGWIKLQLDGSAVKSVTLTKEGHAAGLLDPDYQPAGIGVFRDDDGEVIAVLVRHPDGTLEIVSIANYAYEPPVDELPDVPTPDDLKSEHRVGMSP